MKYGILLIFIVAACGPKTKGPNKFSDDTQLIQIYEYQDLRNTEALLPLLKAKKESHRVAAALAFASIQDTIAIPYLNQMLQIDQDPMPRKAAAYALGQIGSPKALRILRSAFDGELYPYNRPNILEAIGKCGDSSTIELFENIEYQEEDLRLGWAYGVFRLGLKGFRSKSLNTRMMNFLNDDNKELAILASHYVYRGLRENVGDEQIVSLMNQTRYEEVRERLYLLLNEQLSLKSEIETSVFGRPWQSIYRESNEYQQAQQINAIKKEYTSAKQFLSDRIATDTFPKIIRNAAFSKYCELYPRDKWSIIKEALKSGDISLQSLAAIELQKEFPDRYPETYIDILATIKSKLILPQQAETFIDICKAIEALGGEKFEGYQPAYNHQIDWDYVKNIPANQQVLVTTNKGEITIELFVEDAPGTVSNFLKLTESDFYNGKYFHRVVPQFVIQGGCPRGDGWGSLNWTQRSEFSNFQSYETGTVGVASAGKDTEGVQFFITHCPTPHLDGRYTIFARVIDGMDVVQSIKVGDKILEVEPIASYKDSFN